MKTCCFCFNPKSGTLLIAVFGLVIKIIAIITLSSVYGVLRQDANNYYRYREYTRFNQNYEVRHDREEINWRRTDFLMALDGSFIPSIIETTISIICCTLLIFGVTKGNKGLFWPWLISTGFEIICGFIAFITLFIILTETAVERLIIVAVGIATALQVYCFRCVITHFRDMRLMSNRTQGMVIGVPYQQMPSELQSVPNIVNVHSKPSTSLEYVISSTPNPPDYNAATSGTQTIG